MTIYSLLRSAPVFATITINCFLLANNLKTKYGSVPKGKKNISNTRKLVFFSHHWQELLTLKRTTLDYQTPTFCLCHSALPHIVTKIKPKTKKLIFFLQIEDFDFSMSRDNAYYQFYKDAPYIHDIIKY